MADNGGWEDVGQWEDVKKPTSLRDVLLGAGEAALSTATGIVGGGLGTLSGTIAGIRQHGIGSQEQLRKVEEEAHRQAADMTYEPRTELGKQYNEYVGKAMEQVLPVMPMLPEFEGMMAARKLQKGMNRAAEEAKIVPPAAKAAEGGWTDVGPVNGVQAPKKVGPTKQQTIADAVYDTDLANLDAQMTPAPGAINPYDVGGHVSEARAGRQSTIDVNQGQPDFFGSQELGTEAKGYSPQMTNPPAPAPAISVDQRGIAYPFNLETDPAFIEAARRKQAEAQGARQLPGEQGLLFSPEEMGPQFNPVQSGVEPVPGRGGLSNRRQMDLQLADQEPYFVDQQGRASKVPSTLIEESPEMQAFAKDAAIQRQLDLREEARQNRPAETNVPDELFVDRQGRAEPTLATPIPLEPADQLAWFQKQMEDRTRALQTEANMKAGKTADMFGNQPEEIAVPAGKQGDLFTTQKMAKTVEDQAVERVLSQHPLMTKASEAVDKAIEALAQAKDRASDPKAIIEAQKTLTRARTVETQTRNNIEKSLRTGQPSEAMKKLRKKQGGGATTDFLSGGILSLIDKYRNQKATTEVNENANNQFRKTPGLKGALSDWLPEQRSMDDIRAEAATRPDVDPSFLDRLTNPLQAGGNYQALKTNNIVVKKTFETISKAVDHATYLTREIVQKKVLPSMRDMNLSEKASIWATMTMEEGKNVLSRADLEGRGFNEKQIKFYETMRDAYEAALGAINQAREAMGKDPLDPRVGYVASVFSGDFRRPVYAIAEDGTKKLVSMVGDNTRWGLKRTMDKLKEAHPDWEFGEEKYYGGQGRNLGERQKAFQEAIEMLADNDPNVKSLVQTYQETMAKDAYDFLNQRKHTLRKQGIAGSEGNKAWQTLQKNAQEGMKAQVKYLEKSFQWAELSKASKELAPMLSDENINMPNAKKWANSYVDKAMGISPEGIGRAIDNVVGAIGKETGIGPTALYEGARATKNLVSKTLLGWFNPMFLATNLVQPIVGSPAMMALLQGRGVPAAAIGNGLSKAVGMLGERMTGKLKGFNKEMVDWADKAGIDTSEIFDHSDNISKDFSYYVNKGAEVGIPQVERHTRAAVFYSVAHVLHEAGLTPKDGIFEAAQRMTNVVMTDYRHVEMPSIYSNLGPIGHMAANLQRFKHNQFSALSLYAREIGRNKSLGPMAVALATAIGSAGIMGMIGFNDADTIYQMLTKAIGKPDTLANLTMKHAPTWASHGLFSAATGIDWSNRLGLQDVVPNSIAEAALPGVNRLVDAGKGVMNVASGAMNGDMVDVQRGVRDLVPNSARGLIDRAFFENDQGQAVSPNTLEPTVQRNDTDKFAKTIGGTGLNESIQKSKLYQQRLIDQSYADIRKSTMKKILDDMYEGKPLAPDLKQQYLDAEGDPNLLANTIEKYKRGEKMTEMTRRILEAASGNSVNAAKRLQRYKEIQ